MSGRHRLPEEENGRPKAAAGVGGALAVPDNAMVNSPAPPFCSRFPSRAALDLLAVAIAAATGIDQSSGTTRRRDNTGPLLRLHPTTLLNGRIIAPPPSPPPRSGDGHSGMRPRVPLATGGRGSSAPQRTRKRPSTKVASSTFPRR